MASLYEAVIIKYKTSVVRSRISSKFIFASCVGYFDLVWSKTRMRCGIYWGACWSKVLVLVWYHNICIYVRMVNFDFSLKYVLHFLVSTSVPGSRQSERFCFSASITCGATYASRILFDTKRERENNRVWPFEVRVMLLLLTDRSRAWMILTGTQLRIACGHTTVVSHS